MDLANLRNMPKNVITALEKDKSPFYNYIIIFFSAVFIRHFIESFSQEFYLFDVNPVVTTINTIQFMLSFLMITLMIALLAAFATKESMKNVMKVIIPCLLLILLGPILDLLFSWGKGADIAYYDPDYPTNMLKAYLTYFGAFYGVSIGLKIEIALMLIAEFIYFRIKRVSLVASIFLVFVSYTLIFMWGSSPFVIKFILKLCGYQYVASSWLFMNYFAVVDVILILPVAYMLNSKMFNCIWRDIRLSRILYYELIMLFGAAVSIANRFISAKDYLQVNPDVPITIMFTVISIFFACLYSLVINNIYDVDIDKITNKDRPLVTGQIALKDYKSLGVIFLSIAIFYAMIANSHVFLTISSMICAYFLYSATPIRFKRVPVLSKLVIGFNSFALFAIGYDTVQHGMSEFPFLEAGVIFIFLTTLAANFIDLKDIAGDKKEGIRTLPILVGERTAKWLLAVAFFVVSLSYYLILDTPAMLPLLIVVGLSYVYLLTKSKYEEWKIFLLTNLSFVFLICFFVSKN